MAKRHAESECEKLHETDAEDEQPVSVCDKTKKKTKYQQKFKEEYSSRFPEIKKSRKGEAYAFCSRCNTDFCISHGGAYDIKRHTNSAAHKSNVNSVGLKPIQSFFTKPEAETENLQLQTTRAEAMICHFIAESNLPLATADKLTEAVKVMCPDSKIAASKTFFLLCVFLYISATTAFLFVYSDDLFFLYPVVDIYG